MFGSTIGRICCRWSKASPNVMWRVRIKYERTIAAERLAPATPKKWPTEINETHTREQKQKRVNFCQISFLSSKTISLIMRSIIILTWTMDKNSILWSDWRTHHHRTASIIVIITICCCDTTTTAIITTATATTDQSTLNKVVRPFQWLRQTKTGKIGHLQRQIDEFTVGERVVTRARTLDNVRNLVLSQQIDILGSRLIPNEQLIRYDTVDGSEEAGTQSIVVEGTTRTCVNTVTAIAIAIVTWHQRRGWKMKTQNSVCYPG